MPLKTYRKSTNYTSPVVYTYSNGAPSPVVSYDRQFAYEKPMQFASNNTQEPQQYIPTSSFNDDPYENKVTMWSLLSGMYEVAKRLVATSTLAGLLIPSILIMTGMGFIYLQFQPSIVEQVKEYAGYYDQGTTTLVADGYITDRLQYVSNPGADYFQRVAAELQNQKIVPDNFSLQYKGTMYLTIPSLGFDRLPISSNVDSSTKDIYDRVLSSSLAHFKGTSVPASEVDNNIVIYGHSAGGSYNPRPDDVLAAFSFLKDLKVGDLITIEMDGKEYKYRMSRSKIVEPTDTSVITGTPGKETLTLFTCHPPGNNANRLVITALPTI